MIKWITCTVGIFCGFALMAPSSLIAQNSVITYQGRITSNGTNFSGTGLFKLAIVTSTNANHTATATASLTGAFVTSYNLVFGGNGYVSVPAVHITGGGGGGATATAVLSGGVVTGITPGSAGTNYSSQPTVTIDPPPPNVTYATYWSNDGSSSAGSEPAAAVSVTASNGLFTVPLGDITVANMTAISPGIFTVPNLQLRIWFDDGVNGSMPLSPLQNLSAAPYAEFANTAVNVSGTVAAGAIAGTYGNAVSLTNAANGFTGTFAGNGASVSNVNALTFAGLSTGAFWKTNGNIGANPTNGAFIGTLDKMPLEFRVFTNRALRLEYAFDSNPSFQGPAPNVIAGNPANVVSNGIVGPL